MANEQNLRPSEYKLSQEEAKKGGINSGIARREKRDLRKCLEMLLERDIPTKNGEIMSGAEAITAKLFEQALKGNVKAFETLRSTVGQDPVQKIMVAEVDQGVINEVEAIVRGTSMPKISSGDGKIAKVNPGSGEIVCRYKTAAQAARENNIDPSNLAKAIKSGKAIGGYVYQRRPKA
jgi:hypothetical protein